MPFKYLLFFGKVKPDPTAESARERVIKGIDKLREMTEKQRGKMLLWGIPMGMHDHVVVVFDIGENIDNFYNKLLEILPDVPFTDGRTHAVYVP